MSHVHNTHADWAAHGHVAITALSMPFTWLKRRRERRELSGVLGFPDYLLKDIGLQRHEIAREVVKPFWRP